QQDLAARALHQGPDHRGAGALPDHVGLLPGTVRPERRQEPDRLHHVGLADAVRADQHRGPGRERDEDRRVIPEVGQLQALKSHSLRRVTLFRWVLCRYAGRRTGMIRYRNPWRSLPWTRAGLRPSRISKTISLSAPA